MRPHQKDVDVLRTSGRENELVWRGKFSTNRMIEDLLVNNLFFEAIKDMWMSSGIAAKCLDRYSK